MDASPLVVESLEGRRLFTGIAMDGKMLVITGAPNYPDTITVGLTPGGTSILATVVYQDRAGQHTKSAVYLVGQVQKVHITGGNKNDLITIDEQTGGLFSDRTTILGGSGNDTIYGGAEADVIRGNAGNDFIDGGAGDDKIVGGAGDDSMVGGLGDDTLRGNEGKDYEDGGQGDDRLIDFGRKQTLLGGDGVDHFVVQGIKRDTSDYDKTIDKITRVEFPTSDDGLFDVFPFSFL